jgi:1-acyl-sn-glycerol-3-phosphate acyltransferase
MIPSINKRLERFMREWTHAVGGNEVEDRIKRLPRDHVNELGSDPFGFDPDFIEATVAPAIWLYKKYFRVETYGLENVPDKRVLIIGNHSGQLPLDGLMIGLATFLQGDPPRLLRPMAERWISTLPFASVVFSKAGTVVGTPENCQRLLDMEEAVLVFPEGSRGIFKPFKKRYQLERFGQGFMRLALKTNTPIVPVAVVGAEEQMINLGNIEPLAKLLRMPAFPFIPQLLIPFLGMMPLPTKYRVYFGKPLTFEGDADGDVHEVEEKVAVVKDRIQQMLNDGIANRKSVFFDD